MCFPLGVIRAAHTHTQTKVCVGVNCGTAPVPGTISVVRVVALLTILVTLALANQIGNITLFVIEKLKIF